VNPEMGITTEATRKHGISSNDVRKSPKFAEIVQDLDSFLEGCDLAGFNLLSFDLPMLSAEFRRVGRHFEVKGRETIDAYSIYVQKEPRDLAAAYRLYCNQDFYSAHSASADARACWDVLRGQLKMYSDLPRTVRGLSKVVSEQRKARSLDSGGWFVSRFGKPAFARGKHQGLLIREVEESDPAYLDWMLSVGLPADTIEIIQTVLPNFGRSESQSQ
jgi:DNA polymerase-3 subunit epsilon